MSVADYESFRIAELGWQHPDSNVRSIASPLPGLGFAIPLPGTVDQIVQGVKFKLVNSAVAGSRVPVLKFLDGTGVSFAEIAAPFTLAASNTSTYTFAVGIQQFGANNAANIGVPIPSFKLDVTHSLSVSIVAVDATDQVSDIRVTAALWPVRPPL